MKIFRLFLALILLLPADLLSQNVTDAAGKKQGHWIKYYPDGKIMYEGTFVDDRPVGLLRRYNEDGTVRSEQVYNEIDGTVAATFYFPDGIKAAEGNYRGKKKEGAWKIFSDTNPSYLISEESYHLDMKQGTFRRFYPDSTVAEIMTWENGKQSGEWLQYYPDGTICLKGHYTDGQLNGPFLFFHPNGITHFDGQYLKNMREGDWKVYSEEGNLIKTLVYHEGRIDDPEYVERETKLLDELEKNRGKISIPDISGNILK